jgi:hypothetical protein
MGIPRLGAQIPRKQRLAPYAAVTGIARDQGCSSAVAERTAPLSDRIVRYFALGRGQAFLSTTLALMVPAGGAPDAAAACTIAPPDEEPVEGEDAELAAGAV